MTAIGALQPRKEDPRLLRGLGRFGDDFTARGQLWARMVRSPVAHGRIRSVDAARAVQTEGVVAAVTAASLPAGLAIPVRLNVQNINLNDYLQPVLAADVVQCANVRMIEAGDGAGFTLETLPQIGAPRHLRGQDFDGDFAA